VLLANKSLLKEVSLTFQVHTAAVLI